MDEHEFKLILATPDGEKFAGNVTQLSVRGVEGDLGILKGHIPFVTALKPHECRIYFTDGSIRTFRCGTGFVNVTKEFVTVLSSEIEFTESSD